MLCKTELRRVNKARCLRASTLSDQEFLAEELLSDRLNKLPEGKIVARRLQKAFIGKKFKGECVSKHARAVDSGQLKNYQR